MSDTEVISAVRSEDPEAIDLTTKESTVESETENAHDVEDRGFPELTDEDLRRLMLESAG